MHEIAMFVEDDAHHRLLDAIIKRLAREQSVEVKLDWRNVRRGYGAVINELKQYMRGLVKITKLINTVCYGHA
jgi:hypothetical protein